MDQGHGVKRQDPQYGQAVIDELRRERKRLKRLPNAGNVRVAFAVAIKFLETRLTDAALHGCHHCDDDIDHKGQPCRHCGLKATGRVTGF